MLVVLRVKEVPSCSQEGIVFYALHKLIAKRVLPVQLGASLRWCCSFAQYHYKAGKNESCAHINGIMCVLEQYHGANQDSRSITQPPVCLFFKTKRQHKHIGSMAREEQILCNKNVPAAISQACQWVFNGNDSGWRVKRRKIDRKHSCQAEKTKAINCIDKNTWVGKTAAYKQQRGWPHNNKNWYRHINRPNVPEQHII